MGKVVDGKLGFGKVVDGRPDVGIVGFGILRLVVPGRNGCVGVGDGSLGTVNRFSVLGAAKSFGSRAGEGKAAGDDGPASDPPNREGPKLLKVGGGRRVGRRLSGFSRLIADGPNWPLLGNFAPMARSMRDKPAPGISSTSAACTVPTPNVLFHAVENILQAL